MKKFVIGTIVTIIFYLTIYACVCMFFGGHGECAEPIEFGLPAITFDEPVANFTLGPREPLGVVPGCFDCGPPPLEVPPLDPPCANPGDPTVPSIPGNPGRPGCGGGVSVPEPNTGWLLLIAVLCLLFVAQRQRKI
jgi:hypothetical protein